MDNERLLRPSSSPLMMMIIMKKKKKRKKNKKNKKCCKIKYIHHAYTREKAIIEDPIPMPFTCKEICPTTLILSVRKEGVV